MQIEYGEDKKFNPPIYYRYIYLEPENKILIDKLQPDGYFDHERDLPEYTIIVNKDILSCNCPGFHWGHCKHVDFATEHFKIGKYVKPKTFLDILVEEFMLDKYHVKKVGIVKAWKEVTNG